MDTHRAKPKESEVPVGTIRDLLSVGQGHSLEMKLEAFHLLVFFDSVKPPA